jgi:hypothetical protein
MKPFSNNQQLYDYLLCLGAELKKRGAEELSEAILFASRHASGMSTEFLGESRISLRRVLQQGHDVLTDQEQDDVQDVLRQLDMALDKR